MKYRGQIFIGAVIGIAIGAWFGLSDRHSESPDTDLVTSPQAGTTDESSSASVKAKPVSEQQLSQVDRKVPSFELPALDNTVWTPGTLKGKPWVINFWATWCPPCIEEIPSMNAAFDALAPQGIGMLAINAGEGTEAVEEFLQRISIDFPNVLGNADTLPNWSVKALPTTIIVDAKGNVVFEALGPREWDDERLLQNVVDLL